MIKANTYRKKIMTVILILIMIFSLTPLTGMAKSTYAVTSYTVTSTADTDTVGTLRWAINRINTGSGGDTINFDPILGGKTITLTEALPSIKKACTFNGNRITISGDDIRGILKILNVDVLLDGITFINARGEQDNGDSAVNSKNGNLTITNCIFSGNTMNGSGGSAISISHPETNTKGNTTTIVNCFFTDNTSDKYGGAVLFYDESYHNNPIKFINCTFTEDNTAALNGNIFGYANLNDFVAPQFLNCIIVDANNGKDLFYCYTELDDVIFKNTLTDYDSLGSNQDNHNNIVTSGSLGLNENGTLDSGSPAIDAGDNSFFSNAITSSDLAGNIRIANGTIDIGAYEFGSKSVATKNQLTYDLTPKTYNGKAQSVNIMPKSGVGKVTVKYNGSAAAPTNAGSYMVTADVAAGINYGAKTEIPLGTFVINKANFSNINLTIPDMTWTGKQLRPVVFTFNGMSYAVSTNVTVNKFGINKNIGKGTIQIAGKGINFTGTRTITFNILPKKNSISKITAGKKQMKVTWKKVSKAQKITKYQVRYRIKGTSKWKTKTYGASKSSGVIKSLKKGKRYEVQVRSYKTVSKVKYYSAWSSKKTSKKIK